MCKVRIGFSYEYRKEGRIYEYRDKEMVDWGGYFVEVRIEFE